MSRDPSEVPNLPQNAKNIKTYLRSKFGSIVTCVFGHISNKLF